MTPSSTGAGYLSQQPELDRRFRQPVLQIVAEVVRRPLGGVGRIEISDPGQRFGDIADEIGLPRLVGEAEGVDAEIALGGETCRRPDRGARLCDRRVLGDEFLQRRRLRGVRLAGCHGHEQVAELGGSGHREEVQAVDHHVGFAAVRQAELYRHAVGIGVRVAVGKVGKTGRVREADGHRNGPG
jgi:hypothetical protein